MVCQADSAEEMIAKSSFQILYNNTSESLHSCFLVPCLSLSLLWRRGMWLAVPLLAFLYTDGDSTVLLGPRQRSINTLSYFKRKTSYSSSLFTQLVLFQMQLWVRWFNRFIIIISTKFKKCIITNFLTLWIYFSPPLHIHRRFDLSHTWLA